MPSAAILGCGPAGLFAAYACALSGVEPFLFSKDATPSRLYGAQFLGKKLPFFPHTHHRNISVFLQGTEDEYRRKVYGEDYTGPVSPSEYVGYHVVYDIRQAYERLWQNYETNVSELVLTQRNAESVFAEMAHEFDFVFSSVPLRPLCVNREHSFASRTIYAIGDAPDLGVRCPIQVETNQIIYCGNRNASWYRAANIFGHCTVEWARKPPISDVATVMKPLGTDCDCYPNVVRLGRYGEWKKGVLAVDAFNKTMNALKNGVQSVLF